MRQAGVNPDLAFQFYKVRLKEKTLVMNEEKKNISIL